MFWVVRAEEGDRQARESLPYPLAQGAMCERDTSAYEISRKQ